MSTYVINWNGGTKNDVTDNVNIDGVTPISNGVPGPVNGTLHPVDVAVSTPFSVPAIPGGAVTDWTILGGDNNALFSQNVVDPTLTTVQFGTPMTDITFDIYDIDTLTVPTVGSDGVLYDIPWDDLVRVYALDINGNPVATAINVTNTSATHTVNTSADGITTTIGATGTNDAAINGTAAADTVTVTIPGPVYGFVVVYDVGPLAGASGVIGLGAVTFTDPTIWCFARGTMIETKSGDVAIESLVAGDMVRTADNGFQPLRWIGSTTVKATGNKAPILFRKGAIGNTKDLLVSPAHRVMLQDWQAELLFGKPQILASAQSLVNDNTIIRQETEEMEYFHILFDSHEIVFSNGAPTESFHPGDADVGTLAEDARAEIYSLFPELENNPKSYGPSVRTTLMPHEATLLSL